MAETPAISREQKLEKVEAAIPVSQRVQIENILLVESSVRRGGADEFVGDGLRLNINTSKVEVGKDKDPDKDSGRIMVRASFLLTTAFDDPAAPPALKIEATFVLIYAVASFDNLNDDNLEAFASTNGIFNAWPYWREYVQSTTSRMCLPAITVPVFRLTH